jgi:hypothetical protein
MDNIYRIPRISLLMILCLILLALPAFGADTNGDGVDDGLPFLDANGDGLDDSQPTAGIREDPSFNLVISSADPYAYFGFYRTTQMTEPGWTLMRRTIDWADGHLGPGNADLLLFTYNNDLEWPVDYQQEDGYALYTWLQGQGFNITGHHQNEMGGLSVPYYQGFDIIIYWNSYAYPPDNAIASGVPFISTNQPHAAAMNIAGAATLHQARDLFCVHDNSYYPTEIYPLGDLVFDQPMWTDGVEVAGAGIGLIAHLCPTTPVFESNTWSGLKSLF